MKTDNEIIAEFLGIDCTIEKGKNKWHYIDRKNKLMIYALSSNDLHFDTSWDWLMPVVEKISKTIYAFDSLTITNKWYNLAGHFLFGRIDEVYKAVVEFIRWYQSTTNQTNQ